MVRRMDRQGDVVFWCRKCSGHAGQRMGPKIDGTFASWRKWAQKEYGKMLKRIQILDAGRISLPRKPETGKS